MAGKRIEGFAYECDFCGKQDFTREDEFPPGLVVNILGGSIVDRATFDAYACKKTHVTRAVAAAVKRALTSENASDTEGQVEGGVKPDQVEDIPADPVTPEVERAPDEDLVEAEGDQGVLTAKSLAGDPGQLPSRKPRNRNR